MNKILISISLIFFILFYQIIRLNANDDTYINSSNITYNEKENIVELAENSKINFKNTNILIDKGIIDYSKNEFEVFGNFYLYEELTILSGKNFKGNTSLDIFSASDVSYIYNDDLKIDSESLEREKNLIYFYNNFLTPCELEGFFNCPTWSLRIDKTEYDIDEDKFTHFDTFLQIADYKVFYLPYFTHYGTKADRKSGFLTPTIEFSIGGEQGIKTPYYIPINDNSDITFTPKIFFGNNIKITDNFELNTFIRKKSSGGDSIIEIDNIKNGNKDDVITSLRIDTKQIINSKRILSASGVFTNSVSTTRSINEDPISFEDIFIRLENYDLLFQNDYLKTELSSVESFDSSKSGSIPISPNISYHNYIRINDNHSLINDSNFIILKRSESDETKPSESLKLNLTNELIGTYRYNNYDLHNKFIIHNAINDYKYNLNSELDNQSNKSFLIYSSEFNNSNNSIFIPRLKIILPFQINNTLKSVNEDTKSITFNYENQFSENRFFGFDIFDTTPRIVYGIESIHYFKNKPIELKINQSFSANPNNSYANLINQTSKFSDYALGFKSSFKNIRFQIDSRLDQKNFSKKEMNYSIIFKKLFDIKFNYYETQNEAFKKLSRDNQSIDIEIFKNLNNNSEIKYISNLDVKNNYNPYQSIFKLSLFDECSKLEITYTNSRFNDENNTKPEEKISLNFFMDYLGFFQYEQSSNLFFEKAGDVNYGL